MHLIQLHTVPNIETFRRYKCFLFMFTFQLASFFKLIKRSIEPFSFPVRVKDGMSLWNGMWNGVRNGIIMRNMIYAGNKLTEKRIPFSRQIAAAFLMLRTLAKY